MATSVGIRGVLKAFGVSKEPEKVQANLLVNPIGSAGYGVYTVFTFEEGENEWIRVFNQPKDVLVQWRADDSRSA